MGNRNDRIFGQNMFWAISDIEKKRNQKFREWLEEGGFEITKGNRNDDYLYWIEFTKNDRVVSFIVNQDKFYLKIETVIFKARGSELFEFANVTSNITRLEEIKEKLENE